MSHRSAYVRCPTFSFASYRWRAAVSALEETLELVIRFLGRFLHRIMSAFQSVHAHDVGRVIRPRVPGVEFTLRVAFFGPQYESRTGDPLARLPVGAVHRKIDSQRR